MLVSIEGRTGHCRHGADTFPSRTGGSARSPASTASRAAPSAGGLQTAGGRPPGRRRHFLATRRPGVAVVAWLTWTLAATLTTVSSVGYVELHTSDTAAGRRGIVATSAAATDQRQAGITVAQLAAQTARRAREAKCDFRGPRCRERETDERTRPRRRPSPCPFRPSRTSPTRTSGHRGAAYVGKSIGEGTPANADSHDHAAIEPPIPGEVYGTHTLR